MKKKILFYFLLAPLCISAVMAEKFPVTEWVTSSHDKPLIFYLSGDGGLNKFSTALCETLHGKGYDVIALNSKSYFWDKKTPEQTATDINNYLIKKLTGRKNQQ